MFMFATCDRRMALGFLVKLYPGYVVEDTPECAGPLLDMVEKDYCRIQDPDFHQPAQVVPGKMFTEEMREQLTDVSRNFHLGLKKKLEWG